MTRRAEKAAIVTEAKAAQVYEQTAINYFMSPGATVLREGRPYYCGDQPARATSQPTFQTVLYGSATVRPAHRTAPGQKVRMFKAEVMETVMLFGCVTYRGDTP